MGNEMNSLIQPFAASGIDIEEVEVECRTKMVWHRPKDCVGGPAQEFLPVPHLVVFRGRPEVAGMPIELLRLSNTADKLFPGETDPLTQDADDAIERSHRYGNDAFWTTYTHFSAPGEAQNPLNRHLGSIEAADLRTFFMNLVDHHRDITGEIRTTHPVVSTERRPLEMLSECAEDLHIGMGRLVRYAQLKDAIFDSLMDPHPEGRGTPEARAKFLASRFEMDMLTQTFRDHNCDRATHASLWDARSKDEQFGRAMSFAEYCRWFWRSEKRFEPAVGSVPHPTEPNTPRVLLQPFKDELAHVVAAWSTGEHWMTADAIERNIHRNFEVHPLHALSVGAFVHDVLSVHAAPSSPATEATPDGATDGSAVRNRKGPRP